MDPYELWSLVGLALWVLVLLVAAVIVRRQK